MSKRQARIQHVGKWVDRLKANQGNPREVAFAREWAEENEERQISMHATGCTLEVLLNRRAEQTDATTAATLMQWLGSNVGWSFLDNAIRKCGYKLVRDE